MGRVKCRARLYNLSNCNFVKFTPKAMTSNKKARQRRAFLSMCHGLDVVFHSGMFECVLQADVDKQRDKDTASCIPIEPILMANGFKIKGN